MKILRQNRHRLCHLIAIRAEMCYNVLNENPEFDEEKVYEIQRNSYCC